MEKILIYPFAGACEVYVRYSPLEFQDKIASLVGFKGQQNIGEKVCFFTKTLTVKDNFSKELQNCTSVWIADVGRAVDYDKYIQPFVVEALMKGKKVLITQDMEEEEKKKLKEQYGEKVKFGLTSCNVPEFSFKKEVYKIYTPIIFIGGIGVSSEQIEFELKLGNMIESKGLNLLQIFSKRDMAVLGKEIVPEKIFDAKLSDDNKALWFNHYLKKLEVEQKPDIIIIGLPGDLLLLSSKIATSFGIVSYKIAQTVVPDISVLLLPFNFIDANFKQLRESLLYKYNMQIDFMIFSNKYWDVSESVLQGRHSYVSVDEEQVKQRLKVNEIGFSLRGINIEDVTDKIIQKLKVYGEIEVI